MRTRLKNADMARLPLEPGEHYHAIHTTDPTISQSSYRLPNDALDLVRRWAGAALVCDLKLDLQEDGFRVTFPQTGYVAHLYIEACNDFTCRKPIG